MAWTQADLDKLTAVAATGAKKIKYGDKETEWHSPDELLRLMEAMKADINGKGTIADRRTQGITITTLY